MQLYFFSGAGTVGGTQILVQSATGKAVFLDFGHNFAIEKQLSDPFLQTRDARMLIDRVVHALHKVKDEE